jgi:hypothetical protein
LQKGGCFENQNETCLYETWLLILTRRTTMTTIDRIVHIAILMVLLLITYHLIRPARYEVTLQPLEVAPERDIIREGWEPFAIQGSNIVIRRRTN